MNRASAEAYINRYDYAAPHTEAEEFRFVEALELLSEDDPTGRYSLQLGFYYYEHEYFDKALKYYTLAAPYNDEAYVCMGYIWYYGRTGKRDYDEAFRCFKTAWDRGKIGNALYKLADMYKNGYGTEKNYEEYVRIIEDMYPGVKDSQYAEEPLPEIFTRLAGIRVQQGRLSEAVELYLRAKYVLSVRIKYGNHFWGDVSIMRGLIEGLYEILPFDPEDFDFYDLFEAFRHVKKICFFLGEQEHILLSEPEGDDYAVCFDGTWYRTRNDFFNNARVGDKYLTQYYDEIEPFEVIE